MLDAFLAWLGDAPGGRMGLVRTITVMDEDDAATSIRWTADGTKMTGRAAAVCLGDRGFCQEAAGRIEN
jgi:hypothetical protein